MTNIVIVQEVWCQCSGNYDAARSTRTFVASLDTTVREILEWEKQANVLGRGDLRIVEEDPLRKEKP